MLRIIDVDYLDDYKLRLTFSTGETRNADLEPYLKGEVFGELIDRNEFVQYGLTPVTIEWRNGADFAPEFLYEISKAL